MKKISKRLLKSRMDALFLSYCYRVASLTCDFSKGEISKDCLKVGVQNAKGKFEKACSIWMALYGHLVNEGDEVIEKYFEEVKENGTDGQVEAR